MRRLPKDLQAANDLACFAMRWGVHPCDVARLVHACRLGAAAHERTCNRDDPRDWARVKKYHEEADERALGMIAIQGNGGVRGNTSPGKGRKPFVGICWPGFYPMLKAHDGTEVRLPIA